MQRFGAKDGPLCLAGTSAGWAPLVDFKGGRAIGAWKPPRSAPWPSLRHSLPAPRCLRTVPTGRREFTRKACQFFQRFGVRRKAWQFFQRFGARVWRTWGEAILPKVWGEGAENLG